MTILHIETSTNVCSVAVSHAGKCIFELSNSDGLNHATMLSPFIEKALEKTKAENLKLDAVAVSGGPGSYTGLRIGVSTAKGLCYGLDIPLISVPTLQVLAQGALVQQKIEEDAMLCPMIDARRMEVYTAHYTPTLELKEDVYAEIVTENSFAELLAAGKVYFFGNGAEKCKSTLTHPNAIFIDNVEVLAKNMISVAEKKFQNKDFTDVAYFEPFYLKEFQATTPKKMF